MKICSKIILLFFVLSTVLLSGCAITPELLKQPPAKGASIGVMSFLGNDANLMYGTYFTFKQDKYSMGKEGVDNYIVNAIRKEIHAYGIDNVFVYHLPEDNRIATQTMYQFNARLSTLVTWERKYIEKLAYGRNFDYLVIIFPENSGPRPDLASLYKYGINFRNGYSAFIGFYITYRIIIMDGKTFDILAQKYEGYFNEMPEFKLDWANNFPKMSNQQNMFYEKWLVNFIDNTMTSDVLTALNLAQIK